MGPGSARRLYNLFGRAVIIFDDGGIARFVCGDDRGVDDMAHALRDRCLHRVAMLADPRADASGADQKHPFAPSHGGGKGRGIIEIGEADVSAPGGKVG